MHNLKCVTIPDTVTSISHNAFNNCYSFEKIICHNDSYAKYYATQNNIDYKVNCNYERKIIKRSTLKANGSIKNECPVCLDKKTKTIIYRPATFKLSATAYIYNGKAKTPSVTVKDIKGKVLTKNKDYTVKYSSGRKNVGKYKVTITFKGNYSGSKTLYFTIKPKSISIKNITSGNKSLKVKVSKRTLQVTGYQIHYSTSKTFKSYKYKYITNYKKDTFVLNSLSAKKTYYVRARSYKKIGNKIYYSAWSTVKYKKTK